MKKQNLKQCAVRYPVLHFEKEAAPVVYKDLAEQLANQHMINAYSNMVKYGLYDLYSDDREDSEKK